MLIKQSLRFVKAKPAGAAGLLTLAIITIMAIFADHVSTHSPLTQNIPQRLTSPNGEFLFGTDRFGRDMFSRVIYGARMSLAVGISSVALSTLAGILIGIPSGYFGGKFDLIVQRFVDTLMAFPTLVLALMIVAALGTSANNVILALFIALTPRMTRIARGEALSIRHEPYVLASQSVGSVPYRVMFNHILPNSMAPIIVMSTGYLAEAIVAEASLSFLGLGVPPPDPSWGRMLQEGATEYLQTAPWLTLFPGIALSLVIFGVTIFGDSLRDVLDPRLSSLISKHHKS